MKKVLVSAMLLFTCFTLKAQNTFPTTGNVGIGTTTPTHKFVVDTGSARFKTYTYGVETTVNDSGGWARAFRFRNEYNNVTAALGSLDGSFYIATGFDISLDPTGYQNQKLTVRTNGNIGIGTTSPNYKLELFYHPLRLLGFNPQNQLGVTGNSQLIIKEFVPSIELNDASTSSSSALIFANNNKLFFGKKTGVAISSSSLFNINLNNGNIGIGTTTPDAKLAVNGKIHTKEVKVDLVGWPDYVFKKEYQLPTLEEVEKYIKEKGHLKDIPSEKEVLKNGLQLGEMNAKLLKKIEELTLYTIAQEKKIKQQEEKLSKKDKELKKISIRLSVIEKQLNKNNK